MNMFGTVRSSLCLSLEPKVQKSPEVQQSSVCRGRHPQPTDAETIVSPYMLSVFDVRIPLIPGLVGAGGLRACHIGSICETLTAAALSKVTFDQCLGGS